MIPRFKHALPVMVTPLLILSAPWTGGPRSVSAKSCACPSPNQTAHEPIPFVDGTAVRNTLLWAPTGPGVVELRALDGTPIPLDERGVIEWTPSGPFDPGRWTVLAPPSDLAVGNYDFKIIDFEGQLEITDVVDDEPPPIPEILDSTVTHRRGSNLGCRSEAHYIKLELETEPGLVVAAFDGDEDALDPAAFTGRILDSTMTETLELGATCGGLTNWLEAGPGATTDIRMAAFDAAGNFSGWGEPVSIDLGDAGCGCSAHNDSRSTPVIALAFFTLLALSRPRLRVRA